MDAATRRKVLTWLLAYSDRTWLLTCTDETHTALFDTSQHVSGAGTVTSTSAAGREEELRAPLSPPTQPSADAAACNLDHRLFRQALDVLCFRVLKVSENSCACTPLIDFLTQLLDQPLCSIHLSCVMKRRERRGGKERCCE